MPARYALTVEAEQKATAIRAAALSTGITPRELQTASDEQLLQLQGQLCLGSTWGLIEVPPEFMSRRAVCYGARTYSLSRAIPAGADPTADASRRVWTELLRLTLAMRLFPGRHGAPLKYSVVIGTLAVLGRVTRVLHGRLKQPGFWGHLTRGDLDTVAKSHAGTTFNLLTHYATQACLPDRPAQRKKPEGVEPARDRTGEPEHTAQPLSLKLIQPLPDAYIAEAGWRAIRVVRDLGPSLLDLLETTGHVEDAPVQRRSPPRKSNVSADQEKRLRVRGLNEQVARWEWRDRDHSVFDGLGFELKLRANGRTGTRPAFPPTTYAEAWHLLSVLQACHLFVLALAAGSRHGEILAMEEGCIVSTNTSIHKAAFWTWKLEAVGGRPSDAPIPELVVSALRQQERLARLVKSFYGVEGNHLWVQVGTERGSPLKSLDGTLSAFHRHLGLEAWLPDGSLSAHRFRKTLARIVALALVHAPKILMDIFGHRDEQMTVMRYILSDPGILSEIQAVVRELIVLKGVEAATKADLLEGPAAGKLRAAVQAHAARTGASSVEPQNLLEFARAMTEEGSNWAIVAPGIVCTAFKTGGICNKHQGGEANPHYCHASCDNQLVFADEVADDKVKAAVINAIETVEWTLQQIVRAEKDSDEMLVSQFSGQIKTLLNRWRSLDRHFAQNSDFKRIFPDVVLLT